jgi:outer membrane biosynthesis protein TonB
MFLDFEDHRPDVPRVQSVISLREGVLLAFIGHLLFLIAILIAPKMGWFEAQPAPVVRLPPPTMTFVAVEPLVDRKAPPKLVAPPSDLDRRSATVERAPKPENLEALSHGNTPEKILGAPAERPAGADSPTPAPPSPDPAPPPPPNVAAKVLPNLISPPRPSGGALGDSLRNLQKYLQNQNFDNERGGQTDRSADIQFDSKGVDFGPWLRRFRNQVYGNWYVPQAAMIYHGHVVLQLTIHRDGSITDLHQIEPSGQPSFNTAAFNALKLSNPTMALPPEYPADVCVFTVTFFYNETIR